MGYARNTRKLSRSCIALFAIISSTASQNLSEVVPTSYGPVQGKAYSDHMEYLGIPYAAAPIGPLRLMPPQRHGGWDSTLEAFEVGPRCLSSAYWFTITKNQSEDCLYMNIWTPLKKDIPADKWGSIPVMLWIYGGGYFAGASDDLQTRGQRLAGYYKDVLVVSFNYRLGVLGGLGSEELRDHAWKRTGSNSTGNQLLLDQQAAMRWVSQNIHNFGGDPNKVMVFGESAGATSVAVNLVSPGSAGLFQRAAMESGVFTQWAAHTMEHSELNYKALMKYLRNVQGTGGYGSATLPGCLATESDLECLQRLPAEELIAAGSAGIYQTQAWAYSTAYPDRLYKGELSDGLLQCMWGPTIDGVALPEHPIERLVLHGPYNQVPVIIGSNKEDGTTFVDGCPNGQVYNLSSDGTQMMNSCPIGNGGSEDYMDLNAYEVLANGFYEKSWYNNASNFPDSVYKNWIGANFGAENTEKLFSLYNTEKCTYTEPYQNNFYAAQAMVGDFMMYCPGRDAARGFTMKDKKPAYQFYFEHTPIQSPFVDPNDSTDFIVYGPGACHGCEIPFVFLRDDSDSYGITGPKELELAKIMSQYWSNFAWNGDPNDDTGRWAANLRTLPIWSRFEKKLDNSMSFNIVDDNSKVQAEMMVPHYQGGNCEAFWHPLYRKTSSWMAKESSKAATTSSSSGSIFMLVAIALMVAFTVFAVYIFFGPSGTVAYSSTPAGEASTLHMDGLGDNPACSSSYGAKQGEAL